MQIRDKAFLQNSTELGRVTVDPFRIVFLKNDARPVKQRPYRHSNVSAAKVRAEYDNLVVAGILRKLYSNWSSPLLVLIMKTKGAVRLTYNLATRQRTLGHTRDIPTHG